MRQAVALDDKNVASHIVLAVMLQRKGGCRRSFEGDERAVVADPKM